MFSVYRSQKNLQHKAVDYKALYLEERRLKEDYQRRAHIAQLKYRKLAQSINKKCIRCMNVDEKKSKEDKILQLKQFQNGLSELNLGSLSHIPKGERPGKSRIIQNFAIFGTPESMLIEPQHFDYFVEGQLLYASNVPSMAEEHAAKLSFPAGVAPKYYSGFEAKEKAVQIMSSSCSYAKSFIMSFESKLDEEEPAECELRRLMNPENRLYAICLTVEDFSLVPNWQTDLIESEKVVANEKNDAASAKVLSCQETDISCHQEKDCNIATSPRVYCLFSYFPFFQFYQQMLKALVNSVKTERLVIYRESGCALAQADSHFFVERVKQTYREICQQIDNWEAKLARQFQLKLINCQKISLSLNSEACMLNFVQDWGLPIFNMFSVDTFLDVFTLVMLEEKVVFVSENPTVLTYAVHLFTQLLPRPFQYPYPTINLLPENQGFFQTLCPFVYGYLNSRKTIVSNKLVQRFANVFVFLQREGVEISSAESKKNILKKRSKILRELLSCKFKGGNEKNRRISNLTFEDDEINFQKDKQGICTEIIKEVNTYLSQEIMKKLPQPQEVQEIMREQEKSLKQGQDLNQVTFERVKKKYEGKSKQEFYKALLDTQIVNTYLFK